MRADAARADRNEAVRQAARDWHRAGILSDEGLKGVEDLYPEDRVRVVYYGCDPGQLHPTAPPERAALRKRLE